MCNITKVCNVKKMLKMLKIKKNVKKNYKGMCNVRNTFVVGKNICISHLNLLSQEFLNNVTSI